MVGVMDETMVALSVDRWAGLWVGLSARRWVELMVSRSVAPKVASLASQMADLWVDWRADRSDTLKVDS